MPDGSNLQIDPASGLPLATRVLSEDTSTAAPAPAPLQVDPASGLPLATKILASPAAPTVDAPAPVPGPTAAQIDPASGLPLATKVLPDDGTSLSATVTAQPAAPPQESGFFSGLISGVGASGREAAQLATGNAFTTDPNAQPEPTRGWFNELGYGIGHSVPVIGGGLAGGAAGGAVGGPVGATIGAALGVGGTSLLQDLVPTYQSAMQTGTMTHEQAVDYTVKHALATGAIGAATAPLFELAPFKSVIGKILFQSLATQPVVGAAGRVGVPLVMGEPLPSGEQMVRGAGQDVATGLGFGVGHQVGGRVMQAVRPRPGPSGEAPPAPETETAPPPVPQVPPVVETPPVTPPVQTPPVTPPVETPPVSTALTVVPTEPPPPEPPPVARAMPRLPVGEVPPNVPVEVSPAGEARVVGGSVPRPEETPTPQPVTTPPDDGSGSTAGRPVEPAPVGEAGAARLPGEQPGGERPGDPGVGVVDHPATPPTDQGQAGAVTPPAEEPAPARVETPPAPTPVVAPADTPVDNAPPARRPVSTDEMAALVGADNKARQALAKAERSAGASPEKLDQLRQRAQETRDQLNQAEGPPPKPTNVFGGPNVGGDVAKTHQAALDAHQAAIDARIHAEGEAPVPAPKEAGKIFAMGGQRINRGTDTAGNNWVGTGHAMVRGDTLERAAVQTAKLKTSKTQTVDPAMLDRVVKPDPKVNYQPVTFVRRVTEDGRDMVVGTRADGTAVAVQKPVYDALHAAAGPGGEVVASPGRVKGKSGGDDRLFARNAQGETVGVGMPIRVDEARAKIWMHGAQPIVADRLADTAATANARGGQAIAGREPGGIPKADQELVPGPQADLFADRGPGPDTGPAADVGNADTTKTQPTAAVSTDQAVSEEPPEEEPPEETPSSELAAIDARIAKQTATRDALLAHPPTRQTAIKLRDIEKQLKASQLARERQLSTEAVARRGSRTRVARTPMVSVVPTTPGPKSFEDYKFNNGTSVYHEIFREAGYDPDVARNKPIAWQNRVLGQHMIQKFGFRNVTVAGDTNPKHARDMLLDMIRNVQDAIASAGLPLSEASLNGVVSLVIDPTAPGKRSWLGLYELASRTIHVTAGSASFGHEWIHALDHYMTHQLFNSPRMQDLLSRHTRNNDLDLATDSQAAMAALINHLFFDEGELALRRMQLEAVAAKVDKQGQPTAAAVEAQDQLDRIKRGSSELRIKSSDFRAMSRQFGNPGYFGSAHELVARSGEAWLARKVENNGGDPRNVVMPSEAYLTTTDQKLRMLYAKGDEYERLMQLWDHLMDTLRKENLLAAGGEPPGPMSQISQTDPRGWDKLVMPQLIGTPFGRAARREIAAYRNIGERWAATRLRAGDRRPDAPLELGFKTRAADWGRVLAYSPHATMKVITARAPAAARPALQEIIDRLAPDPGSGRLTHESFEERHQTLSRVWTTRMGHIFANNGLAPGTMSALEGQMIRHFMITGDTVYTDGDPIPPNIQRIGGALRRLSDEVYDQLEEAGFDLGYAKNGYFQRIYDRRAAGADPTGFHDAAVELHQLMFDRDIGTPGDDPEHLLERWTQLNREERNLIVDPAANRSGPEIDQDMKQLQANFRQQAKLRAELEANPNHPTAQADIDALQAEAKQMAIDLHEEVRDHIAHVAADNWYMRLVGGDGTPHDLERLTPSGRYLNGRVLPPEADLIMKKFLETDPLVVMPQYFASVARRVALAERFGTGLEDYSRMLREAVRGGINADDLEWFKDQANLIMGRGSSSATMRKLNQFSNYVSAMGAMTALGRVAWSQIAEPINSALATGSLSVAWKTFANQFGAIMHTASSYERAEAADLMGVTVSAMHDTIMLARSGADYSDTPQLARMLGNFYRLTGATQITAAQRRANAAAQDWFLRKLSKDLLNTDTDKAALNRKDDARRWFNELGIGDSDSALRPDAHGPGTNLPPAPTEDLQTAFASWMIGRDKPMTAEELLHDDDGMAANYGLAIRRLVDRSIQDPKKADKPGLSSIPILGLTTQLMTFNYAFQKNILDVIGSRIEHAYSRGKEQAYEKAKAGGSGEFGAKARGYAAGVGAGSKVAIWHAVVAATAIAAALLVSTIRQYTSTPDQWKKHQKEGDLHSWLLGLAMSRSGMGGTLDPVGQVYDNLKYGADVNSLALGMSPSMILKNAQALIAPFQKNTDRTPEPEGSNTLAYNQARAAYSLFLQPLEVYALSRIGTAGGPLTMGGAAVLQQYLTSSGAADRAATFMAGRKGTTLKPRGGSGLDDLGSLGDLGDLGSLDGGPPMGRGATVTSKGSTGGVPLGLLDDFLMPVSRVATAVWSHLPGPVKVLGGVGAAGAVAYKWWHSLEPWREESQKQDKQPKKPEE